MTERKEGRDECMTVACPRPASPYTLPPRANFPISSSKTLSHNVSHNVRSFCILEGESSSCFSPVHFWPMTFPDRARKPRKNRPYFGGPRSHGFTRKQHSVSRPRRFTPLKSHASELLRFSTDQIFDDDDDDDDDGDA